VSILKEIEPYLSIKKKRHRAKHIISKYHLVTPRNGKYNKEMLASKEKFYTDFMAI